MYSYRKPFTRPTKTEVKGPQKKRTKKVAAPVVVEPAFNPEATDGDGDGLVQDGTIWERPVESEEIQVIMESEE